MKYCGANLEKIEQDHYNAIKPYVSRELEKYQNLLGNVTHDNNVVNIDEYKSIICKEHYDSYCKVNKQASFDMFFSESKKALEIQLHFFSEKLELILRAKKDNMINLKNEYEKEILVISLKPVLDALSKKVFSYRNFKQRQYNNRVLVRNLNVRVCPYCNRQYVIGVDEEKNVTPHLDHYYCQKEWPMFAVSFYNLIPSCQYCNQLKGENDAFNNPHFHPYFDECEPYFEVVLAEDAKDFSTISDLMVYKLTSNNPQNLKHSEETFNLSIFYKEHKLEFNEIVNKYMIYSKEHIKKIQEVVDNNLSISEIERDIFELSNPGNHGLKPLDKFRSDIYKSLKSLSIEGRV